MLGRFVADPDGVEGPAGRANGLGLLDIETILTPRKTLAAVTGVSAIHQIKRRATVPTKG